MPTAVSPTRSRRATRTAPDRPPASFLSQPRQHWSRRCAVWKSNDDRDGAHVAPSIHPLGCLARVLEAPLALADRPPAGGGCRRARGGGGVGGALGGFVRRGVLCFFFFCGGVSRVLS